MELHWKPEGRPRGGGESFLRDRRENCPARRSRNLPQRVTRVSAEIRKPEPHTIKRFMPTVCSRHNGADEDGLKMCPVRLLRRCTEPFTESTSTTATFCRANCQVREVNLWSLTESFSEEVSKESSEDLRGVPRLAKRRRWPAAGGRGNKATSGSIPHTRLCTHLQGAQKRQRSLHEQSLSTGSLRLPGRAYPQHPDQAPQGKEEPPRIGCCRFQNEPEPTAEAATELPKNTTGPRNHTLPGLALVDLDSSVSNRTLLSLRQL